MGNTKWRRLHSEELHDLYYSSNTVWVIKSIMRWAGYVACMEQNGSEHRVLVGKTEGTRPLGRPRYRWEDSSKTNLQDIGWKFSVD
jgi:hypothetical protein